MGLDNMIAKLKALEKTVRQMKDTIGAIETQLEELRKCVKKTDSIELGKVGKYEQEILDAVRAQIAHLNKMKDTALTEQSEFCSINFAKAKLTEQNFHEEYNKNLAQDG